MMMMMLLVAGDDDDDSNDDKHEYRCFLFESDGTCLEDNFEMSKADNLTLDQKEWNMNEVN